MFRFDNHNKCDDNGDQLWCVTAYGDCSVCLDDCGHCISTTMECSDDYGNCVLCFDDCGLCISITIVCFHDYGDCVVCLDECGDCVSMSGVTVFRRLR